MLADAYKIASDIKNAMPTLRSDAVIASTSAVIASFKSKIKSSLQPLKHRLSSVTHRLDNYMANDLIKFLRSHTYTSFKHMTSVKDCMIEMAAYVNAVIDNADVYEGDSCFTLWRYTPPGQINSYVCAYQDIDNIAKAAIKCIDIIDKHVVRK